jgi:PAS domain S-box-containing protein
MFETVVNGQVSMANKTDISTRQALEHKIEELEAEIELLKQSGEHTHTFNKFIHSIIESFPGLFYILDVNDFTIKMANSATYQARSHDQQTCYSIFHNRDTPCENSVNPCPLEEVKKTGKPVKGEHLHYDKDGIARDYEIHGVPFFDKHGNVAELVVFSLDITENKRNQAALAASEKRFRQLSEAAFDGIAITEQGVFREVNTAFADMFGFSPAELIGKNVLQVVAPQFHETVQQNILSEYGKPYESICVKKDGEQFPVEVCGKTIQENGRKLRVTAIREISDRKRAEEEREKNSEKIMHFAYSVAHDLKNPAVAIYGLAKILSKNSSAGIDEKTKNYCDQILKSSEQIAILAEKINMYISAKEELLQIERVRLKEIIQMIREEFSTQLAIRQIQLLDPENMPDIMADRISLLRVFRNLVDNALKYGGDGLSEIEIGYRDTPESHILFVRDDGGGISKEDSKGIFGLFKRVKTSAGVTGTGLGLAVVKEIAQQHQGGVWTEHGPKKGITFFFSISKSLATIRNYSPPCQANFMQEN